MLKRAVAIIQDHLKQNGLFAGSVDGVTGPITKAAVRQGLTARQAELPAGWQDFPADRPLILLLQLICKDKTIDCEPVDGYWGPVTQHAYESLVHLLDTGSLPPNWRDDEPSDANPHVWPRDRGDQQEMRNFYGPPGSPPIERVRCPWTLKLAWDTGVSVTHIGCHAKVAVSVEDVLRQVWDPAHNQLKWGRDRATLDHPDYDFWWRAWEAEGWVSLGRSRNFDWMHVQAARL